MFSGGIQQEQPSKELPLFTLLVLLLFGLLLLVLLLVIFLLFLLLIVFHNGHLALFSGLFFVPSRKIYRLLQNICQKAVETLCVPC